MGKREEQKDQLNQLWLSEELKMLRFCEEPQVGTSTALQDGAVGTKATLCGGHSASYLCESVWMFFSEGFVPGLWSSFSSALDSSPSPVSHSLSVETNSRGECL